MAKWLMVKHSLTSRQTEKLSEQKITYAEVKITEPEELVGLTFPEEEKDKILKILRLARINFKEVITDIEKVFLLKPPTIIVNSWEGYSGQREEFVKMVKEILSPLKNEIVIYYPHGLSYDPIRYDEDFRILVWSSTRGRPRTSVPRQIWGIDVDCREDGFGSPEEGIPIVDTETDWVVAELIYNTDLYIFHDLFHYGTKEELAIARKLLQEVAAIIAIPSPLDEEQKKRMRQVYAKECDKRMLTETTLIQEQLENEKQRVVDYQHKLTNAVRSVSEYQEKAADLNKRRGESSKKYQDEFDKLLATAGVANVRVFRDVIQVFTDQIDIVSEGLVYDIGKFRIDIYTAGDRGGVMCFNLTRIIDSFHHPHIELGYPCWGNLSDGISKLIGEHQYAVLAQVIINYLKSVNLDDDTAAESLPEWPVKKKLRTRRKEKKSE